MTDHLSEETRVSLKMKLFMAACVGGFLAFAIPALYRLAMTLWVLFHICQGAGCQ